MGAQAAMDSLQSDRRLGGATSEAQGVSCDVHDDEVMPMTRRTRRTRTRKSRRTSKRRRRTEPDATGGGRAPPHMQQVALREPECKFSEQILFIYFHVFSCIFMWCSCIFHMFLMCCSCIFHTFFMYFPHVVHTFSMHFPCFSCFFRTFALVCRADALGNI